LRSVSVELTTDPTTPLDLDTRLPFLVKEREKNLISHYPNVFTPNYSSFIRR
jgi:hypothetical protein